jgi:PKD repeat protein
VARLDATNVAGSSFDEVSIEVVGAVAPVAAMLIRPEDATVGQGRYATFTARSTGTRPVTHEWVFAGGDPATATGFGPHAVQFWDLGPHDVSITTTNAVGQDTDTQVLTVVEAGAKVWNGSAWGGAMMADAAGVYHPMRVWVDGVWVDVQPIDLPGG